MQKCCPVAPAAPQCRHGGHQLPLQSSSPCGCGNAAKWPSHAPHHLLGDTLLLAAAMSAAAWLHVVRLHGTIHCQATGSAKAAQSACGLDGAPPPAAPGRRFGALRSAQQQH